MPLVTVLTSSPPASPEPLLRALSRCLAEHTGKPERWVMTALAPQAAMTFGGDPAPACYLEVKNIGGFTAEGAEALSAALCRELQLELGIAPERVYVEFSEAREHLWGWNGGTFA